MSTEKKARDLYNEATAAERKGIARVKLTVEDAREIANALLLTIYEVNQLDWRPDWLKKITGDQ